MQISQPNGVEIRTILEAGAKGLFIGTGTRFEFGGKTYYGRWLIHVSASMEYGKCMIWCGPVASDLVC